MKHYKATKDMTGKALTDYIRDNLQVGDIVQYQGFSNVVIAKIDGWFWLRNSAFTKPVTGHPSGMDILKGM